MISVITKRLFTSIKKNLILSIRDKVALIELNRPQALNSLNSDLMNELRETLAVIEKNESLLCVILTGNLKSFAGISFYKTPSINCL